MIGKLLDYLTGKDEFHDLERQNRELLRKHDALTQNFLRCNAKYWELSARYDKLGRETSALAATQCEKPEAHPNGSMICTTVRDLRDQLAAFRRLEYGWKEDRNVLSLRAVNAENRVKALEQEARRPRYPRDAIDAG